MVDYPPQALAPQECDVEQCDFWQQGETNEGLFDFCTGYCDNCNKHPNCNFRQLQSQQKTTTEKSSDTQNTFIKYEVRDILNGVLLDYLDKPSVDAYRLDVLKQFEKAME